MSTISIENRIRVIDGSLFEVSLSGQREAQIVAKAVRDLCGVLLDMSKQMERAGD